MTRVSSAPVTTQPDNYDIDNTFTRMGNEVLVHECMFQEGNCGCITKYYTTLTDARLLLRTETTNCRYQPLYSDVSIFLRDIAELRRSTEARDNCDFCRCCVRCCRSPTILEIRGVFGSKTLHVPNEDMDNLQFEIPARAGNHKLISRH